MEIRGRNLIKGFILCVCIGGFGRPSYAIPTVQTAACINDVVALCATSITDVDIIDTVYDVVFSQLSYAALFSEIPPTFMNDDIGGIAAVNALVPLLNAAGISGLIGAPTDAMQNSFLFVPTMMVIEPLQFNRAATYSSGGDFSPYAGGWVNFAADDQSLYNPDRFNAFAVFTPSSVEVSAPSVIVLFGLGLLVIGSCRRKRF